MALFALTFYVDGLVHIHPDTICSLHTEANGVGLGRFVSCCSNIVSSFAVRSIVVTTSPNLNSTFAFG